MKKIILGRNPIINFDTKCVHNDVGLDALNGFEKFEFYGVRSDLNKFFDDLFEKRPNLKSYDFTISSPQSIQKN